jgi:alkylation response protein AidB-like acyl-CoA dehydrogenase
MIRSPFEGTEAKPYNPFLSMPSTSSLASTGCSFFSETPGRIFTPEDFGSDDRLMIETAEQFSRKEILPLVERLEKQEEGLMPGLIRKAGELGFCGVDGPEAYGGLGLGKNLAARILEFLSLDGSFSVTLGVTSGIGQVGLSWFGTEEQKSQYLPKVLSGEWIAAYCLSEPNAGSDALSVQTRADERNGKWVLNGTKMWISNAKWADLFLVMAKIGGEQFSAFLVERSHPGVKIEREEHKLGLKGSSTARVTLEDAEIPLENLLHEPGKGHQVAFNALNLGRFKLSSMSMGPARQALGESAQYAKDRRQFGQPIANFGLIQKKFAEMAARFYVAESMIARTGALIDGAFDVSEGTPVSNMRAAEEYAVECSMCKVFATEAEAFIVDEALQVYGGYGFTEEFPLARHYRDARVSRIYEGTNEINRVFIASRLRKRIEEGRAASAGVADSFIAELVASAFEKNAQGQIAQAALSDLLILQYAEQSSRLRAKQAGGAYPELDRLARTGLNQQAAAAYQMATGEGVSIPEAEKVDWNGLAEAVYQAKGPLQLLARLPEAR